MRGMFCEGIEETVARRWQRGRKVPHHRMAALLQREIGPWGALIGAGSDGFFVLRQEMSCEAVPTGSSTPFREPSNHGRTPVMMVTALRHHGGPLVLGDSCNRRTRGPPHFLPCSSSAGAGGGS